MAGGGNRTIRFQYGEVEHGGHAEERLDADRAAFPLLAPLPPLLRDHAWRVEQRERRERNKPLPAKRDDGAAGRTFEGGDERFLADILVAHDDARDLLVMGVPIDVHLLPVWNE